MPGDTPSFRLFRRDPTNADMVIGSIGVVEEAIDSLQSTGRVRIDNLSWRARSADGSAIPAGRTVKVLQLAGVTVLVTDKFDREVIL